MRALRWLLTALVAAGFVGILSALRDPVRLVVGTWDVQLPFGLLFFFLFAFGCLFVLIDRLLQQLSVYERWRKHRQTHKARAILLKGLGALATRDIATAQDADKRIDVLWRGEANDPFRLVFKGRLAESLGETDTATSYYKELAQQKDARLFALRSQLRLAQQTRNQKELRRLSKDILKLAPDDLMLYDIRIDALRADRKWGEAHDLLRRLARSQKASAETVARMRHDVYLDQSDALRADKKWLQARHAARQAHKLQPSAEAIGAEIDGHLSAQNRNAALGVLKKAWRTMPDADLLPYWKRLAPQGERFKFYQTMLKINPQSPLTQLALVEAAVEDNKAGEARAHLDALGAMTGADYEFAAAKATVARDLDRDRAAAHEWQNRADALRQTRLFDTARATRGLKTRLLLPDAFA